MDKLVVREGNITFPYGVNVATGDCIFYDVFNIELEDVSKFIIYDMNNAIVGIIQYDEASYVDLMFYDRDFELTTYEMKIVEKGKLLTDKLVDLVEVLE